MQSSSSAQRSSRASTSRRVLHSTESTPLVLPEGCELVADTFVVFQWQGRYCTLQNNVTMYCWGQRRSGAIEHVLERYGWTHSAQLHRVSSNMMSQSEWRWLQHIFVVVQRLFDDRETGDMLGRVRWLNIIECRLVFELLRRECYHHHGNLYPKASVLPSFMKSHGVEVDGWPDWYSAYAPPLLSSPTEEANNNESDLAFVPATPRSGSSTSSADSATTVAVASALGAREWLSDVHITNLMFLLLHGQMALPLDTRDLFQSIYPMTDELFVQMLGRSDPGTLLAHAKTGGVTFAFINPNNNHWRLIVLDGMRHQVVLFDPLGVPLPHAVMDAISTYVGPAFHMYDLRSCLQAEGWNCGVWAIFMASRYVRAAVAEFERRRSAAGASDNQLDGHVINFQPSDGQDEYVVLNAHCSSQQRQQNRRFAQELRQQYETLLIDAEQHGRLLYSASAANADSEDEVVEGSEQDIGRELSHSARPSVARAGMARSAARGRHFINVPVAELVWIDLTDDVGAVEVEQEEEMEQSYEDLADNFIEFREDNAGSTDAASLRYSLPAKLQSDVLQQQIVDFRAYRRQRFSLFRRGPLVEETTISGNIKSLLRFLGYLHYEQSSTLNDAPLDMTVFALPNISSFVLGYVEWLEQRRGKKRQAADDNNFQPISCATVSNYLNSLVSIVKFQLRHDLQLRDPLLDQLRNLRSQAESYTVTQKRFEKVHPEWCTWPQLQLAREKCRAVFDQIADDATGGHDAYVLHLRELCLLCLFTICPPPRCSIIRLLEWDKTLMRAGAAGGRWVIDLTDLTHAASRHKTHKRKGALQLPLPSMVDPYLTRLYSMSHDGGPTFPARASTTAFIGPTGFTNFVKTTFAKYTQDGKAPNPSLLRSIFTTWLYGLRYDTEDAFLAQIKASSAQWKAHSEQIAATVYNKQLMYQQREFAVLLNFCEVYAGRFAYDGASQSNGDGGGVGLVGGGAARQDEADKPGGKRRSSRLRARSAAGGGKRRRGQGRMADIDPSREGDDTGSAAAGSERDDTVEYVVSRLIDIRNNDQGVKQVQVAWQGYRRHTWEPYESIQQQLPEMVDELEQQLSDARDVGPDASNDDAIDGCRAFLQGFIDEHGIGAAHRWNPDRVAALELAASLHCPPIRTTVADLVKSAMALVRSSGGVQ